MAGGRTADGGEGVDPAGRVVGEEELGDGWAAGAIGEQARLGGGGARCAAR